jgi:CTP synthase (UTP-ammonia lyase)
MMRASYSTYLQSSETLHNSAKPDYTMMTRYFTEIGGCVGDIESLRFIEAIRRLEVRLRKEHSRHPPHLNSIFGFGGWIVK